MTHNIQSVFYDLLDQHNRMITSDSVEVDINKPISELKRAVYIENDNKVPGCKATDFHIYPPNTTDYIEQSECTAEDTIEDVLGRSIPIAVDTNTTTKRARKQKYIILIARPPPPLPVSSQSITSDMQQLPEQDVNCQYWCKLLQADIENNAIDLTPATALGMQHFPSKVYIRNHYDCIYNRMLQMEPTYRFIVRGTPGIGKSMFAVYLMYRHRNVGSVVYHPRSSKVLFIYTIDSRQHTPVVYKCNNNSLNLGSYLRMKSTLYIVDGRVPRYDSEVLCNCVMITSPNNKLENEYRKVSASAIIMPTWTYDELQKCRTLSFQQVAANQVKALYNLWGGIPRYVLQYADNKLEQNQLQAAIDSANLQLVRDSVGLTAANDNISHRLIHIIPSADYTDSTLNFASMYVADQISNRILQVDETGIRRWIESTVDQTATASLRGVLFERIGHRLIAAGGNFGCRSLNAPASLCQFIHLERSEIKTFTDITVINTEPNNYYWKPRMGNFPVVDAIQLPNRFYQYTVSLKHSIVAKRLQDILQSLNMLNKTCNLYFVVPDNIYSTFQQQAYVKVDGESPLQQIPHWTDNVNQYVISLKMTQTT